MISARPAATFSGNTVSAPARTKRQDFLIICCAYNGGNSRIVLACIVKNTFCMASIKRCNDEACTGNAGGFQNPFPAGAPENHLVPRLLCPAKAYQIGLDRNVRSLCGLKHEGHQPALVSTTTQDYAISEILTFRADGGFFGVRSGDGTPSHVTAAAVAAY